MTGASPAVVTVSTSWAWCIFLVWALVALAGLARVVLATIQIRRLRAEVTSVDMQSLHADLRALMEELQRSRPVSLLVSRRLEVPTAVGFRKPGFGFRRTRQALGRGWLVIMRAGIRARAAPSFRHQCKRPQRAAAGNLAGCEAREDGATQSRRNRHELPTLVGVGDRRRIDA
jgi:hypothetical protein